MFRELALGCCGRKRAFIREKQWSVDCNEKRTGTIRLPVPVLGKSEGRGKFKGSSFIHPTNRANPELLRTWDKQHNGAVFMKFNPVQEALWSFEPGRAYARRYRVYVYDGQLTKEQANRLWEEYTNE